MKTIIKNGTIITADSEYSADLVIENEIITEIGRQLDGVYGKEIDAKGKYILPGGVDNHAHFEALNTDGVTTNAGYETTYVALLGGTTTIVDFCTNEPGMNLIDSVRYRLDVRAKGKIAPDLAIHACCTDFNEGTIGEIKQLVDMGVPTMKLFMAYKGTPLYMDDSKLLACLDEASKHGMTIMVHAENPDVIDRCRDLEIAKGHYSPKYHYMTRPQYGEAEAVSRAIRFAEAIGCPLCIVHVSCKEAGELIYEARQRGVAVIGEICPHHLVLDRTKMDTQDWRMASRWVCSPPLRDDYERNYLWDAIREDHLSIIGSDNASIPMYQKEWGWDEENNRCDFRKIPNGCPGAGDRLNILWTFGVMEGKISRQRFVDICATTPARLNGLYPRKGTIQIGSDADVIVFDPLFQGTISVENNPTGIEYNVFEGMKQIGRAETVLLRGKVVVDNGKYVGTPGEGRFIPGKAYTLGYDI